MAQDSYHSSVLEQLETEYGITGGEFLFSDNELTTLDIRYAREITDNVIDATGDLPFSKVLELNSPIAHEDSWDAIIRFPIQLDIFENDVLLLVVWVRSISSELEYGRISHVIERGSSPYPKFLKTDQLLDDGEWHQCLLACTATEDLAFGQARYNINLGYHAQMLQIAGPVLINYKNKYLVDELPRSTWDLSYKGRESDAPWRADANNRIEQYRKGGVSVRVVDQNGIPLENAQVDIDMKQHQFGFGTNWKICLAMVKALVLLCTKLPSNGKDGMIPDMMILKQMLLKVSNGSKIAI